MQPRVSSQFASRARTRRAPSILRAAVFTAGTLLTVPSIALADSPDVPAARAPGAAVSNSNVSPRGATMPEGEARVPAQAVERAEAQSANPTQLQLPDEATNSEVRSEYGIGLVLMIAGGVIVTALVVGLFMVLMRKTWSASH